MLPKTNFPNTELASEAREGTQQLASTVAAAVAATSGAVRVPLGSRHELLAGVLLFLFGGRHRFLATDPGRGEGGQHRRGLRRICDAELEPVWRRQARG
jgi:hypothetical protein